jgi:opacity protein-like surface antigen
MLAASGGAQAQSGAREDRVAPPKASVRAAKKAAVAPRVKAARAAVQLPPPVPAWAGLYGGVSFGPASIRAATSSVSRSVSTQTQNFGTVFTSNSISDTLSNGSGRNWGALSDIYLGYNFRLGGNIIAGVQVEGTIANAQALLSSTQRQVTNTTAITTPPGTTTTSSTVTTQTFISGLAERWAASGLARLGIVVDPRDLIYVIGGYTYGGFDWNGRVFGLNGATVGGGWEHSIAPGWTLKAEYRYTQFEDKNVPQSDSVVSNQTSPGFTVVSNSASTTTDRASGIALHAFRLGITHYFDSVPAAEAYAFAAKAPVLATPWDGSYGGVSYGPVSIRATTSTASRTLRTATQTPPAGAATVTNTITDTLSNGSGRSWGALSDIYLGYNFRAGGNVIAGVQVEGTIAEAQAQLNVAQVQTSTSTRVPPPPGAITTTSTVSAVNFGDGIAERWAVSALGRLGVLVDPRDLVYAIGGYTHGGFEYGVRTFGLNGATVGGGWEHEVAPGWTLKAEYRYTQFEDKTIPRSSSLASTQTNVSATGLVTTTVTNSVTTPTDRVSGIALHALRLGLTHYFDAPAAGAYAMASTASPPAAAPWTGLYGGVSAGLTSMHTRTASTAGEVFNDTFTTTGFVETFAEIFSQRSNTRGRQSGGVADIFLGYSAALGTNVIAGVQAEGSLAHASTREKGTFAQSFTDTIVDTPPGGAAGTSINTGGGNGTTTFGVQSRWMVSALARLGYLIDSRDLVYAVGGWSYGGFTTFDRVFNLNGPTVGGGIEREVAPSWTVKAEYRYTRFAARNVPFSQTQTLTFTSGTDTETQAIVFNESDRIGANLHALRFGISHYFSTR